MRTSAAYAHSDSTHRLRRRRLVGLGLFGAIILASLALNGWHISPIWSLFDDDEGTYVLGDPYTEWAYVVCDGKRQRVAVFRDGKLEGADGLRSLRTLKFRDRCDLPTADIADLGAWRAQLAELDRLTHTPGASARKILDVAGAMPFSYLYLKPISDWVHADAANAVDFLDALAAHPMRFEHPDGAVVSARRAAFATIIDAALGQAVSSGAASGKIDKWLGADQIGGQRRNAQLLKQLAVTGDLDASASATMLGRLDSALPRDRANLYTALAANLVDDPKYATLLAKQLRLVPHQERTGIIQSLLSRPDSAGEFAVALLADFSQQFHGPQQQLDVFESIARKLSSDVRAPLLLSAHLRDIPGVQRRMAATYLLGLDRQGETAFALGVLAAFDDLHPLSRPKVAYAVMQSDQFRDRRVQEACLLAIQLETRGNDQQELLAAMLHHRDLDSELYTRIRSGSI
jgi:hypothetical protein